jgi:MFS transporter, FHS family, glucose/mannose:H+ symporter
VAKTIRRGVLFGGAATGTFVFGIVMAVLGTLFGLPEMRERLHLNLAQQGNMFLLLYIGIFVATLIAGPVIDAIGNKVILVVSSALVGMGIAGFAFAHSFVEAVVPALLLGAGGGGLNTSTNALVSDLYGERRGPMLNILGIFYGVGALCIPLLAAAITGHFAVAPQLLFCTGLGAACALLFLMMDFPPGEEGQNLSWRDALQVARYPGVLMLAFLLFCQSGDEASIAGWTSTYVGDAGLPAQAATFILAAYWAAVMVGRLLVARLLKFLGNETVVLLSGIGAFLGAALILANRSTAMLIAGIVIIGFSYAGIFPTTLAIAGDAYRKMAGTVFGLLFAIALLGGMSFPWAVGHISQAFGVRYGMVIPLSGAAGICALSSRIVVIKHRNIVK